jgi:hypothetical protein
MEDIYIYLAIAENFEERILSKNASICKLDYFNGLDEMAKALPSLSGNSIALVKTTKLAFREERLGGIFQDLFTWRYDLGDMWLFEGNVNAMRDALLRYVLADVDPVATVKNSPAKNVEPQSQSLAKPVVATPTEAKQVDPKLAITNADISRAGDYVERMALFGIRGIVGYAKQILAASALEPTERYQEITCVAKPKEMQPQKSAFVAPTEMKLSCQPTNDACAFIKSLDSDALEYERMCALAIPIRRVLLELKKEKRIVSLPHAFGTDEFPKSLGLLSSEIDLGTLIPCGSRTACRSLSSLASQMTCDQLLDMVIANNIIIGLRESLNAYAHARLNTRFPNNYINFKLSEYFYKYSEAEFLKNLEGCSDFTPEKKRVFEISYDSQPSSKQ